MFGLDYLDESLSGISPNDLILLGAQTGRGKTQLATYIASEAAKQGKRVFFFALEAAKYEIEQRLIYAHMTNPTITVGEYMRGETSPEVSSGEAEAVKKLSEQKTLWIFYKSKEFSVRELERYLLSLQDEADLVILDHFHFIDYDADKTEIGEHKRAVKKIRELALELGKPILLLAHLNKSFGKSQSGFAGLYDFYGTGDLVNIATKVVTLSPFVPEELCLQKNATETYTSFFIPKFRADGSVTNYLAIKKFSCLSGSYSPGYCLYDIHAKAVVSMAGAPRWAKSLRELKPHQPVLIGYRD